MKKKSTFSVILIIILIALTTYTYILYNDRQELVEFANNTSEIVSGFEKSINAIVQENIEIDLLSNSLSGDVDKSSIQNRINRIKNHILDNHQLLNNLEKRLNGSHQELVKLKSVVKKLKKSLHQKKLFIKSLQAKIDTFSGEIVSLQGQVIDDRLIIQRQKDHIMANETQLSSQLNKLTEQALLLNTVYYAVGTPSELIKENIIQKSGGFLGLGRVYELSATLDIAKLATHNMYSDTAINIDRAYSNISLVTKQNKKAWEIEAFKSSALFSIIDKDEFQNKKILVILIEE